MIKATAKATVAAKKLGKTSQASAKVLENLFPACSAGSKRKFDPYSESDFKAILNSTEEEFSWRMDCL